MTTQPRLNGFSVIIVPEKKTCKHYQNNGAWYVDMPGDNTIYSIELGNANSRKCDALVEVDGESVGSFRLNEYGKLLLERPSYSEKRFTFFVGGSEGSKKSGYSKGQKTNGLIKVTFRPEKEKIVHVTKMNFFERSNSDEEEMYYDMDGGEDMDMGFGFATKKYSSRESSANPKSISDMATSRMSSKKEGITGLSGQSAQKFIKVDDLDYDEQATTTIMVRLVVDTQDIEPLRKSIKSTSYPEPV
jgi:hypothetical protein